MSSKIDKLNEHFRYLVELMNGIHNYEKVTKHLTKVIKHFPEHEETLFYNLIEKAKSINIQASMLLEKESTRGLGRLKISQNEEIINWIKERKKENQKTNRMSNFTDSIRKKIEQDELEEALEKILNCLEGKNTKLYNEAILHKSSLINNNNSQRQGIQSNEETRRVRARIRIAILSLISEIDREGIECGGNRGERLNPISDNPEGVIIEYSKDKLKILFLGANPINTTRIRIDKELREIEIGLRMSKERESILLSQRWAMTPSLLQQAILDENPNIIHFSGHGEQEGIVLEDINGDNKIVNEQALEGLISLFSDTIKCVVLNSCYSEKQALAISKHIPYVIGMKSAIPDKTAISFAIGFYRAIGAGKDIQFAYKLGINSIQLEGDSGDEIPILIKK